MKSDSASAENRSRALTFDFRICPGRFIAERNGIAFVAALVQNYDILPKGASSPIHVEFDDGLLWSVYLGVEPGFYLTYVMVSPRT